MSQLFVVKTQTTWGTKEPSSAEPHPAPQPAQGTHTHGTPREALCGPATPNSRQPQPLIHSSLTDVLHHHRVVHRYMDCQGAPGVKDSKLPAERGNMPLTFTIPDVKGVHRMPQGTAPSALAVSQLTG